MSSWEELISDDLHEWLPLIHKELKRIADALEKPSIGEKRKEQ